MRYLSDSWLQAADQALEGLEPLPVGLLVGYVVTGGPDGERRYSVRFGPDAVRLVTGTDNADVVLRLDWDLAVGVALGQDSAQRAFLDGGLRLAGDVNLLLAHGPALTAFEDRLATLRTATDFGGAL
ncbi:MAG: SCP2 sterol-binding domain-containing protein [Actinomycetota bacterium]|nr:SCP2 sterol-binding domain-containing protein [Actinomycetota bacterium]